MSERSTIIWTNLCTPEQIKAERIRIAEAC